MPIVSKVDSSTYETDEAVASKSSLAKWGIAICVLVVVVILVEK